MTLRLHGYIHFKGEARQALEFYASIFGGKTDLRTFADYHMRVPEEEQQNIMHGVLMGDNGVEFMASDAPSSMVAQIGDGSQISFTLSGDDEALLRGYWEKLSDGATISAPLEASPWGDTFGQLTDKFGVEWMVDISPAQPITP